MAEIKINNKPIIIDSITYDGTTYKGPELNELVTKHLSEHLSKLDEIDFSKNKFTVYTDHLDVGDESFQKHAEECAHIVRKTRNFIASPQSPLSSPRSVTSSVEPFDQTELLQRLEQLQAPQDFSALEAKLESKIDELKELISHNQGQLADQGKELQQAKEQAKQAESLTKRLQNQLDGKSNENSALVRELNSAKTTANQAAAKVEGLEKENAAMRAEAHTSQQRVDELETAKGDAENRIADLTEQQTTLEDQINKLEQNLKEADAEKLSNLEKASLAQKTVNELTEQLKQQTAEIEGLQSKLAAADNKSNAVNQLKHELNQKLDENTQLNKELIAAKAALAQQNTKLETFEKSVHELEAKAVEKERVHSQILQELKNLLAEKERIIKELRAEIARLKALLEKKEEKPPVADKVEVVTVPVSQDRLAQEINAIKTDDTPIKLSKDEQQHFKANMLFLRHPIQSINESVVELDNRQKITEYNKNTYLAELAEFAISENKKTHKKSASTPKTI